MLTNTKKYEKTNDVTILYGTVKKTGKLGMRTHKDDEHV